MLLIKGDYFPFFSYICDLIKNVKDILMKLRIYLVLILCSMFVSVTWAQVQFSQPHGLYEVDELTVSITPSEEGLAIHYTTDGSVPDPHPDPNHDLPALPHPDPGRLCLHRRIPPLRDHLQG